METGGNRPFTCTESVWPTKNGARDGTSYGRPGLFRAPVTGIGRYLPRLSAVSIGSRWVFRLCVTDQFQRAMVPKAAQGCVKRTSPFDWAQGREYVERRNVKRKIRIAGFPYERSTPYIFSSFSQTAPVKRFVCMNPVSALLHLRICYQTTIRSGRV